MKPGTPGFIGARLREAREARGLSASSLADLLGVTRQAISQYEHDIQSPRPEITKRICDCLNLPQRFFLRPMAETPEATTFYRSMSAATKAARIKAERRREWLRDIVSFLKEYIVFPPLNYPMFDLPNNPNLISDDDIEIVASQARQFWHLGHTPIANVVRLLENSSTIIARDYLDAKTLDAFSLWDMANQTPYIMLNADKGSACRSRTDIAHELGHLLLHRRVNPIQLNKKEQFELIEHQAFKFAGAFLLTADGFAEDFYAVSLDSLRALQQKWKVSLGVMIERARDLGLISDEQRQHLWININRRGWRLKEPLDDETEIEQPQLLRKSIALIISEGIQNKGTILEHLPYASSDIEALTDFCLSSLGNHELPLKIKATPQVPGHGDVIDVVADGKILQFKHVERVDN
jgi:Zn-dependent peptidase ImmA (M78 family)/transcriptional regulator with XRE-family HTH domain